MEKCRLMSHDGWFRDNVICFLSNFDIMILGTTNKRFHNLVKSCEVTEYMKIRKHPVVFNSIGNFCSSCNLSKSYISSLKLEDVFQCWHIPKHLSEKDIKHKKKLLSR